MEFEDNFDGISLDTSKWEIQPWGQGALKNSVYMEVNLLENVQLSDGICHITAKKEKVTRRVVNWQSDSEIMSDGLPNLRNYNYTSANIWTKQKFFHGKYEIRCRLPEGKGFWPAFWMFGGKRWNEIDVFDAYSGTKKWVTSIGHDFDGTGSSNGCNDSRSGYDLTEWHNFTCLFDFDKIAFLIDGSPTRIIHRILTSTGQPVDCDDNIGIGSYNQLKSFPIERMSIILNMALIAENSGGSFIPVDESTPFPSSFEIDYVKKWKKEAFEEVVSLQPNPTLDGKIRLKTNSIVSKVNIYNIEGKVIYQNVEFDINSVIDISSQPDGIYLLKAQLSNSNSTFKFVKCNR